MNESNSTNEYISHKMYNLYNKCQEQVSKILQRGISPTTKINLDITREQEKETWKAFLDANEELVKKFFPGEPKLTKHPLYLIPYMVISTDVRDEYYRVFKSFNEYLANYYGYIISPKSNEVLRKLLDRINILAMHYSRLATIRELHRRSNLS